MDINFGPHLIPDMIALGWTAMWIGMSRPKERNISAAVVIAVCVTPWIGIGVNYTLLALIKPNRNLMEPWIPWLIAALLIDVGLSVLARMRLRKNFRVWAIQSAEPPLGFWGYIGRFLGSTVRRARSENKLVD